jgi:hypothetical protein
MSARIRDSQFQSSKSTPLTSDVRGDTVTLVEPLDLVSHGDDGADGLMTGDQRELGDELSLVDVRLDTA